MFNCEDRNLWDNVKLGGIFVFMGGYTGVLTSVILGHFVNCMTGTVTETGVSIGELHLHEALVFFLVVSCFIFGAYTSAKIIDNQKRGHIKILIYEAVALIFVSILSGHHEEIALIFAGLAMGIQNGMTTYTTWTRGKVRTTHVTGTSTDIGVSLATGDYRETGFTTFQAFTYLGGAVFGFYVARDFGAMAFFMNAVVLLLIALLDTAKNSLEQKAII